MRDKIDLSQIVIFKYPKAALKLSKTDEGKMCTNRSGMAVDGIS